jgi:hypothetical protein
MSYMDSFYELLQSVSWLKVTQNPRDRELIVVSDRLLRMFIDRAGCLEWHDWQRLPAAPPSVHSSF